jgi:putative tributyrin esterase
VAHLRCDFFSEALSLSTTMTAGEHEWGYWDTKIQDVLAWLPLADRGPA